MCVCACIHVLSYFSSTVCRIFVHKVIEPGDKMFCGCTIYTWLNGMTTIKVCQLFSISNKTCYKKCTY